MSSNWYDNDLSIKVMKAKYLHDGETSYKDLIDRVSGIFISNYLKTKVHDLMEEGKFFPAGRSLYGAGSKGKFNATMSNCYIMRSPEDSLDDIYEVNREIAKIFKSGGGIGVNLSKLRPNGAKTNNAARTSTGAASFVNLFNSTGEIIGFHGRRGATLVGLNISHPDIEEFIDLRKKHSLKAMNISCVIDDSFMQALKEDSQYTLHFQVEATGQGIVKRLPAKELWNKIIKMNYDYGDPGILFIDTINENNLQSNNELFDIEICNPCAEYTGPAYNSCNLGSIDLYSFVKNKFTKDAYFDYEEFHETVKIAVAALDEILDYGYDLQPLDKNREIIDKWRSIGLGFMGFADALIALNIEYGSTESLLFASKVSKYLMISAMIESSELAKKYGVASSLKHMTPEKYLSTNIVKELRTKPKDDVLRIMGKSLEYGYEKLKDDDDTFYDNLYEKMVDGIRNYGLRNAQLISIAPTGSLAILDGNASSGIEPLFKIAYKRSTHGLEDRGIEFEIFSRSIKDLIEYDKTTENPLKEYSAESIKKKYPAVVDAYDINPIRRVCVQGAIQPNIDNAISSTVNLKHEVTYEDIDKIYKLAYVLKLKGTTVFRDGCKRASILGNTNKRISLFEEFLDNTEEIKSKDIKLEKELAEKIVNKLNDEYGIIKKCKCDTKEEPCDCNKEKSNNKVNMNSVLPISRKTKNKLYGATYRKRTACVKSLYVTVNRDEDGNIFEVFTNKSIHGCSANIATITRMTSLALRCGVKVDKIIEELKQNSCQACMTLNREHPEYKLSLSCPYAIAEALEEEYKSEFSINHNQETDNYEDREFDIPVEKDEVEEIKNKKGFDAITCPKCGRQTFIVEGDCGKCIYCGECKCD